ncbi:CheR family methyltransferase [Frigoriglobus tundricola]|uniref:protein-glutamate O-methyltransferase n=1 Tax=Frigoriglobus tundricola TaxID=2774151 RepID=A0A6M5YVG6_9BACT|nr:protein-glutamate O-methyltransferase CheR [Frigoriglobus tundricola]QJW98025.1 Chemotaxis protein methyltransferase CheR [Frigoriglobus tundricola]
MLSTADFNLVRDLVRSRSGVVLDDEKAYLADSRLRQLAKDVGMASATEVVATVRAGRNAALTQKMVEAMTTNETSFFRDGHPFEALQTVIVPELMRRRAAERRLTIWCGACSTGQEPYSVAMVLREHFPSLSGWDVRILATDLCTDILARARSGRYTQMEIGRGMPQDLLAKYFDRDGTGWVVRDTLRKLVEFRQYNLLSETTPIGSVDVIFMRNVLIYFDIPTKHAILDRARGALRTDGYLFLGGSETTWNLHDGFARVPCGRAHFYRVLNIGPPVARPRAG